MPAPTIVWRAFDELTLAELYRVLQLRGDVFVVEQACAFREIDGRDGQALHGLVPHGIVPHGPDPDLAGYLRILPPGIDDPLAHIGRVATAAHARRTGLGRRMMLAAIAEIARRFGPVTIAVAAQTAVEPFYAGLGFARVSADFDEDGIPHCHMRRAADE